MRVVAVVSARRAEWENTVRTGNGGSAAFGPRKVVVPSTTRWTSRSWNSLFWSRWAAQSTIVAVVGSWAASSASPTSVREAGATNVAPAASIARRFV